VQTPVFTQNCCHPPNPKPRIIFDKLPGNKQAASFVDYILKIFCDELILIVNFHLVFQQSRTY
jgi:hypothetical protein